MIVGLESPEAISNNVIQWLTDIAADERDHTQVDADLDHDSRHLNP